MEISDQELIDLYINGQASALEGLVQKYKRPLYSYIINMTEGREDADEIFQEVWLRVIKKLTGYKHKNFFGWIVRIAHNLVIDRARKKKPDVSMDDEKDDGRSLYDLIEGGVSDPLNELADRETGKRVAQAVLGLPEQQREVFLMRMQAGLSFKEIAEIQKISINTALARMQYALTKLRPMLQADYQALNPHIS